MSELNWTVTVEDMASEPGYVPATSVTVQPDDFISNPESIQDPLINRGFGVITQSGPGESQVGTESQDDGIVMADPLTPAHTSKLVSVVTKWPTTLDIPTGGDVVAIGMSDDEIAAIQHAGYKVYPTMEEYAEALWLSEAQ